MTKKFLTSAAVVGVMLSTGPAFAFDESTWNWDYDVQQDVDIDFNIDSDIDPTGHVGVESVQTFNGDVVANAAFYADQVDESYGNDVPETITVATETPIEGSFTFSGTYDANSDGGNVNDDATLTSDIDNFDGEIDLDTDTSEVNVQPSNYTFNGTVSGIVTGEQEVDLSDYLDEESQSLDAATEMSSVVGSATAIANYRSLQTETATFLDESQIHNATNGEDGYGVTASAIAGTEEDPIEGAVDLTATAISNYMSVQGSVDDPNNVAIANLSQETNANVLASATSYQDLSAFNNIGNYEGLEGVEPGTVAHLSATAIGNYSSFNFGPSVDLGPVDDTTSTDTE